MTDIKVPRDAQSVVQDFLMDRTAALPDDIREKLIDFVRPGVNSVEASLNMVELIYARREELPVELLQIGANIATMIEGFGFNGMGGPEGRAAAIAYTIRQMPGVVAASPSTYEPPEPKPEFTLPSEPLEEQAAPVPEE